MSQLTDWDNLLLAYRKAAKGKRGQANVAAFEHRLEDHLCALQHELRTGVYRPGPYTSFYIHEPKRRLISAAPFRDRVVHHALCQLIEPRFERSFITGSYANRVGKGTHRALDQAQRYARRFPYVLQCDLRQFFPSIDHAVLRDALHRKTPEPELRWLIDLILQSGEGVLRDAYEMVYFPGDDLFAALRPRGLPIGNLTAWARPAPGCKAGRRVRWWPCASRGVVFDEWMSLPTGEYNLGLGILLSPRFFGLRWKNTSCSSLAVSLLFYAGLVGLLGSGAGGECSRANVESARPSGLRRLRRT